MSKEITKGNIFMTIIILIAIIVGFIMVPAAESKQSEFKEAVLSMVNKGILTEPIVKDADAIVKMDHKIWMSMAEAGLLTEFARSIFNEYKIDAAKAVVILDMNSGELLSYHTAGGSITIKKEESLLNN